MNILSKEHALHLLDKIMSYEPLGHSTLIPLPGSKKVYNFLKKNLNETIFFVEEAPPTEDRYINIVDNFNKIYIRLDDVVTSIYQIFNIRILRDVLDKKDNQTKQVYAKLAGILTQVIIYYLSFHAKDQVFRLAKDELIRFYEELIFTEACDDDDADILDQKLSSDSKRNVEVIKSLQCPGFENHWDSQELFKATIVAYRLVFYDSILSDKFVFGKKRWVAIGDDQWNCVVSSIAILQDYKSLKNDLFNLL